MSDALDLGDALRANVAAAGGNLDSDTPLISGAVPAARDESDNPFQAMLDNDGALPEAESPAPSPATTTDSPVEEPVRADYVNRLKDRYGVDLTSKYKSDDDLLQAHVHLNKKLAERDELAQLGKVAAENPHKLIELYKQRGLIQDQPPPPKQPEPPQQPTVSADVPEWDDDWNQYIERGRLAADTPPAVQKDINEYYRAKTIAKSPQYQKLNQELAAIKEHLARQQQQQQPQQSQQELTAYIQTQEAEKLINRNAKWLFKDGQNHQSGLTTDGFVWVEALKQASTRTNDPDLAIKLADQEVALRKLSTATPAPTPNKQSTQRVADPARPQQPLDLLSGDIIRPGEDIAAATKRLMRQLKLEGADYL